MFGKLIFVLFARWVSVIAWRICSQANIFRAHFENEGSSDCCIIHKDINKVSKFELEIYNGFIFPSKYFKLYYFVRIHDVEYLDSNSILHSLGSQETL